MKYYMTTSNNKTIAKFVMFVSCLSIFIATMLLIYTIFHFEFPWGLSGPAFAIILVWLPINHYVSRYSNYFRALDNGTIEVKIEKRKVQTIRILDIKKLELTTNENPSMGAISPGYRTTRPVYAIKGEDSVYFYMYPDKEACSFFEQHGIPIIKYTFDAF